MVWSPSGSLRQIDGEDAVAGTLIQTSLSSSFAASSTCSKGRALAGMLGVS